MYSPGFTSIFLIWRTYGLKGLGSFLRRLTLVRMPLAWLLFLVIGIPALKYIGAALNGTAGEFPYSPWILVFPALAQALFLGTIEEFGWRGIALPLLQRKMAPVWASLVVGIIWAVWHLPAFLLGGGLVYGSWAVVPFFIGLIALSMVITPLFNSARGSILIAYLAHFQLMNPIVPEAQPWENYIFAIAAVVIVILNRRTMFKKGTGVTEVLMPEYESETTHEVARNSLSATAG